MIYFLSTEGSDTNPGTLTSPWKNLESVVNRLAPGDLLYIRGGEYHLTEAVQFKNAGQADAPIVISGYVGETAVFDAVDVYYHDNREKYPFKHETGAFFLYQTAHVQIRNITVKNSHGHGIEVRDSNHIVIDGCTTENTYCCGISLWDTKCTQTVCHNNKIIGNTVIKATTWDMLPLGQPRGHEPPHEAISVAGACYFEVSHNHVYNCDKEGIDVKEVSHHGTVHHNHVHHVDRQGLYADAWFGPLTDVAFYENYVHHCRGAGIVVSVEDGEQVSRMQIYNNRVEDNFGSGFLFGVWGKDGPRSDLDIFNNIILRNGYGPSDYPGSSQNTSYFWITGGISLLSANASDVRIFNNITALNKGFQIGYSDRYLTDGAAIEDVFAAKNIQVYDNIIGETQKITYPIITDGTKDVLFACRYENDTLMDADTKNIFK